MNSAILEKGQEQGVFLFTYHKQSGYIGFICAMIFVMILESVGVSFLLYKKFPVLHWLHLILCLLFLLFLIIDLRLILKNPISIKGEELSLKIGIRPKVTFNIKDIKEVISGSVNYENDRKKKEVLDLSLLGFDQPTLELVLYEPIKTKNIFGKETGPINRIFFSIDDRDAFYQLINKAN